MTTTRVAAEVVLRFHEDLVKGGLANIPPALADRTTHADARRLRRRAPLDAVLTKYRISPHPRLVLVVEGETEMRILPRVMAHFEVRTDEDFIAIHDAKGVSTNLGSLVDFAARPRVVRKEGRRSLTLIRPPTRVLVVFDAEGPVATEEQRQSRREAWLKRLMPRAGPEYHLDETDRHYIRTQLADSVRIETWTPGGSSFEFAHFTDRQIAIAIDRLDGRPRKPDLARLTQLVGELRRRRQNLKGLMNHASKPHLADELWPVLERKLARATAAKTEGRIPVVRILDLACDLAVGYPRGNVAIGVDP